MEIRTPPHLSYGIRQTCEATGLGRSFIYKEIANGNLSAFKVGSRRLIAADALAAWLDSFKADAP